MAVRNKVLAHVTGAAGTGPTIYTCPAGFVTIVKSVIVWTPSNASGAYTDLYVNDGQGNAVIVWSVPLSTSSHDRLEFWFCLDAGYFLAADVGTSPVHFWVSGAELPVSQT